MCSFTYNTFFNIQGGIGDDLLLTEVLLTNAHDNIDLDPKFVGESVASGTWTSDPTYDRDLNETTLTDANAAWKPNAFVGALTNAFPILGNTATTMRVRGDVGSIIGDTYVVDDYRLQPDSPLIDAGDNEHAPSEDFLGNPRPIGDRVDIGPYEFGGQPRVEPIEPELPPWDVNADGSVNVFDLVLVGGQFGQSGADLTGDVNDDGTVNVFDLVLVGSHFGESTVAAAPALVKQNVSQPIPNAEQIRRALAELEAMPQLSRGAEVARDFLRAWLTQATAVVTETKLLANYPSPFNPETWIPYQLSEASEVTLTIYDVQGGIVKRIDVGHQAAGYYQTKDRAAYWDGRNEVGEIVSSGIYFVELKTEKYRQIRRISLLK